MSYRPQYKNDQQQMVDLPLDAETVKGQAIGALGYKDTVTDTEVADNSLSQSKINGLSTSLNGKLDKIETTSDMDRAYVVTKTGVQGTMNINVNVTPNTMPIRDNNGNVKTGTPVGDTDAANKAYVDSKAVDTSNLAKLNEANTFTAKNTFNGGIETTGLVTGNAIQMNITDQFNDRVALVAGTGLPIPPSGTLFLQLPLDVPGGQMGQLALKSDIPDIDEDSLAKLNQRNTFTQSNTFNGGISVSGSVGVTDSSRKSANYGSESILLGDGSGGTYTLSMPYKDGTIATTGDIDNSSKNIFTITQDLTNEPIGITTQVTPLTAGTDAIPKVGDYVYDKWGNIAKINSSVGSGNWNATPFAKASSSYTTSNPPPYPVTSVSGKKGTVTLAKGDVGLANVDNVRQYSVSNPPPYPVTSVNNKTGAVTLSASDVGAATAAQGEKAESAYSELSNKANINGNYPNLTVGNATNATNATNVTSNINGKTISSIFESNGTTVKNATNATNATSATNATNANHATNADSATKATQDGNSRNIVNTYAEKTQLPNPNLLLNPDFRVNQRGNLVYTANTYTLDRWEFWYGATGGNVTKSSVGYISINCGSDTSKYAQITQNIDLEDVPLEVGKYYTLSMEYADSVADANAGNWKRVNQSAVINKGSATPWIWTKSNDTAIFLGWSGDIPYVKIETKSSIWVHSVKLEKGQTATEFIHPIYSEELLKCMRYFERINGDTEWYRRLAIGYTPTATVARFVIPYLVKKRESTPSIVVNNSGKWKEMSANKVLTVPTSSNINASNQSVQMDFTSSGFTPGNPALLYANGADCYIDVDAEL